MLMLFSLFPLALRNIYSERLRGSEASNLVYYLSHRARYNICKKAPQKIVNIFEDNSSSQPARHQELTEYWISVVKPCVLRQLWQLRIITKAFNTNCYLKSGPDTAQGLLARLNNIHNWSLYFLLWRLSWNKLVFTKRQEQISDWNKLQMRWQPVFLSSRYWEQTCSHVILQQGSLTALYLSSNYLVPDGGRDI